MDAHSQAVMAAKGQTLSVAFYPRKGVICYGSEQAAVKVSQDYCFIVNLCIIILAPTYTSLTVFPPSTRPRPVLTMKPPKANQCLEQTSSSLMKMQYVWI